MDKVNIVVYDEHTDHATWKLNETRDKIDERKLWEEIELQNRSPELFIGSAEPQRLLVIDSCAHIERERSAKAESRIKIAVDTPCVLLKLNLTHYDRCKNAKIVIVCSAMPLLRRDIRP